MDDQVRKLLKCQQVLLSMRSHLDRVQHQAPDNYGIEAYHWARELLHREMYAIGDELRIAEDSVKRPQNADR